MKLRPFTILIIMIIITSCSPKNIPDPTATTDINALVGTMMSSTLTAIAPTPVIETETPIPEPTETLIPFGILNEDFGERFIYPNSEIWSEPLDVARIQPPHIYEVISENGFLKYVFPNTETYLYTFYQKEMPADVQIETSYLNVDTQSSEASIACRVDPINKDRWYDFRIVHFEKAAVIYYFEKKEVYGDQYTRLAYAKLPVELFRDKENRLEARCQGDTLTLSLNGQQVISIQDSRLSSDGLIGIGGMSHKRIPMSISFNYVKANPAE